MRKSSKLQRLIDKWEGERVLFYLMELPENRGEKMIKSGPWAGTVFCVTTDEADYDGCPDNRKVVKDCGSLMIRPDNRSAEIHYEAKIKDCSLLQDGLDIKTEE